MLHPFLGSDSPFAWLFRAVITLSEKNLVVHALLKMHETGASGVGIVGPAGNLCGNISASDLKDIYPSMSLRKLFLPISEFLMNKVMGQVTPRLVHIAPQSTIVELLRMFKLYSVHRVYLVAHELKPIGVITLADVLSAFAVTFPTPTVALSS